MNGINLTAEINDLRQMIEKVEGQQKAQAYLFVSRSRAHKRTHQRMLFVALAVLLFGVGMALGWASM